MGVNVLEEWLLGETVVLDGDGEVEEGHRTAVGETEADVWMLDVQVSDEGVECRDVVLPHAQDVVLVSQPECRGVGPLRCTGCPTFAVNLENSKKHFILQSFI